MNFTARGLIEREIFSPDDFEDDSIRISLSLTDIEEDLDITNEEMERIEQFLEADIEFSEEVTVVNDFYDALKMTVAKNKSMRMNFADGEFFIIDAFTAKRLISFTNRKTLNTASKTKWGFFELLADASLGEKPGKYDDY